MDQQLVEINDQVSSAEEQERCLNIKKRQLSVELAGLGIFKLKQKNELIEMISRTEKEIELAEKNTKELKNSYESLKENTKEELDAYANELKTKLQIEKSPLEKLTRLEMYSKLRSEPDTEIMKKIAVQSEHLLLYLENILLDEPLNVRDEEFIETMKLLSAKVLGGERFDFQKGLGLVSRLSKDNYLVPIYKRGARYYRLGF